MSGERKTYDRACHSLWIRSTEWCSRTQLVATHGTRELTEMDCDLIQQISHD